METPWRASANINHTGETPRGARWRLSLPSAWNGRVLVHCPGFGGSSPDDPIAVAPAVVDIDHVLATGTALVGCNYSESGWAVRPALDDLPDVVAGVRAHLPSAPASMLLWGESMGGLVAALVAERADGLIDGALVSCGSVAGAVAMMNQSLDVEWSLAVLLDQPAVTAEVLGQDDAARVTRAQHALATAASTAAGTARVALAAALGQLPTWSQPGTMCPAADDVAGRVGQQAAVLLWSAVSPREDMHRRAGGCPSWNVGVDYAAHLADSGCADLVRAAYAWAGVSLEADLARLADAPRIHRDEGAVERMHTMVTPTGRLAVPVVSVHQTGDAAPVVTQTSAHRAAVVSAGRGDLLRQLYVDSPGHCSIPGELLLTAVNHLERRVHDGSWGTPPAVGFTELDPPPFLRPAEQVAA